MNYWLVRAKWGVESKKAEFINNDEWVNFYDDKYLEIVKRVETEDILLLAEESTITHYGKCVDNPKDGKHLTVDKWELLAERFLYPSTETYTKPISQINNDIFVKKILEVIEATNSIQNNIITGIEIENFTVFKKEKLEFSDGINVVIGKNGLGKTHLLKIIYGLSLIHTFKYLNENITGIFKTGSWTNLISWNKNTSIISLNFNKNKSIAFSIYENSGVVEISGDSFILKKSVFIPAKEILSFYEGFIPLYENRETSFDAIYYHLAKALSLPNLKNIESYPIEYKLLCKLEEILEGKILLERGRFYLVSHKDNRKTEIALIAEGLRKIGMIAQLLANGSLTKNSILFWDEPETNLNPKLMRPVVEMLIELQRMGAQVFVTTHDYVILKEFDLQCNETDKIMFHSLFKNPETGEVECHSTANYLDISPNAIDDTFGNIIDREISKSMGNLGK